MSVARNTGYNLASQLIPMVVSLATVPLYLRIVGVERYGVLALCWGLLGFLGFLNLGMGPAVAQKIASMAGAPASQHARVFWTALWLNIGSGIVGAVLVLVLAFQYFGNYADMSGGLYAELRQALPWLSTVLPVAMVGGVLNGTLIGHQRFLVLNVIGTGSSLLMSTLPLAAAYWLGPDLENLIAATLLARVAGLLWAFVACVRPMPVRRPGRLHMDIVGQLLTFGGWVTATSLIAPFLISADQFAIGALLGPAAVSLYVIPFNLVWRIVILPTSLAGALSPRFAAATPLEAESLQGDGLASLTAIYMPMCIVGVAGLGPFMHLWLGPTLAADALPVAYVIVLAVWANGVARIPHALIEARGRPDLVTKLLLVYILPYTGLLYLLLLWFGILGVAIACCVKSFADPVAFMFLAKTPRRVVTPIIVPTLLVFTSVAAALLFPWTTPPHWVILGSLLIGASLWAIRTMPVSLRARLSVVLASLRLSRVDRLLARKADYPAASSRRRM